MRFDWKLLPLQRKFEWDLELARGRLGAVLRKFEHAGGVLHALEDTQAEQAAAALAATRRHLDPIAHAQALAYLAGMEARVARGRVQHTQVQAEVAAARAECQRCGQRLESLDALHDLALAQFTSVALRDAAKVADLTWLARAAGGEPQ